MDDPRQTVGQVSERTLKNSSYRTCSARIRNGALHWSFWTDRTRWLPELTDATVLWWERGPTVQTVRYRKWYWLRFGVALIEPCDEHERMNDVY